MLREATALVQRAEIALDPHRPTIFIGFRRNGCGSIFLEPERVYHFNSRNQFRRGYVCGRLLKAERGRLAAMVRQRTESEVQLLRKDLTERETAEFLRDVIADIEQIAHRLAHGNFRIVGQVPDDGSVLPRITAWLDDLQAGTTIAASPHAR